MVVHGSRDVDWREVARYKASNDHAVLGKVSEAIPWLSTASKKEVA